MFNLDKFIADSVTFRPESMFKGDIEANAAMLTQEIKDKKVFQCAQVCAFGEGPLQRAGADRE